MRSRRHEQTEGKTAADCPDVPEFIHALTATLDSTHRGNLDARVELGEWSPELLTLARQFNHTLDLMDAFVRESDACLTAAAAGHFYREFLLQGIPGDLKAGARRINDARHEFQVRRDHLEQQREQ